MGKSMILFLLQAPKPPVNGAAELRRTVLLGYCLGSEMRKLPWPELPLDSWNVQASPFLSLGLSFSTYKMRGLE